MKFSKNIKIIKSQSAGTKYKFTVPQRLHTDKLVYAYLVGLIKADGWFCYSKNRAHITFEVGMELHSRDTKLLYRIKELLGFGLWSLQSLRVKTNIRPVNKKMGFVIRKKEHLKQVIQIFDPSILCSLINTRSIYNLSICYYLIVYIISELKQFWNLKHFKSY